MKKKTLFKALATTAYLLTCSILIGNTLPSLTSYTGSTQNETPVNEQIFSDGENVFDTLSPQSDDESFDNKDI